MKIQPIGAGDETRRTEKGERAADPRPPDPARPGIEQDRVELSDVARRLTRLASLASALPEIRQERVEALRREITTGRYGVDASALAHAILENEDGLFR